MLEDASFTAFIPVGDASAARRFYVDTLGLEVLEESPFAIVVDARGTTLRLTPVPDLRPQPFTIAGWEVDDIAEEVDLLVSAGVPLHRYEGMDQDERGIWTSPGGARVAWFSDTDGNTLSLTSVAGS